MYRSTCGGLRLEALWVKDWGIGGGGEGEGPGSTGAAGHVPDLPAAGHLRQQGRGFNPEANTLNPVFYTMQPTPDTLSYTNLYRQPGPGINSEAYTLNHMSCTIQPTSHPTPYNLQPTQ